MGAEFNGKKIIVIGGSAGMGRQAAIDVVRPAVAQWSSVADSERVADTVSTLTEMGKACGLDCRPHRPRRGGRSATAAGR